MQFADTLHNSLPTFHQPSTEVGAGAIRDFLDEHLGSVLVGLGHAGEAKLQFHTSVIRHQGETVALLHCMEVEGGM